MKRFFKTTSVFVLPIIFVWSAAEFFYRMTPTNYSQKRQNISDFNDSETLIFGNSHTFYGLDPKQFDGKAYNLANISQSLYFDALLFDQFIDSFPKVKNIILNVEYTSLSHRDDSSEESWRNYFYHGQMDLDVPMIKWYDPRKYSLALAMRFRTTLSFINQVGRRGLVTCDADGWGNDYNYANRVQDLSFLAEQTVAKHEDGSVDFRVNTDRIRRIIEVCERRNIEVLLVTMPVSKAYSSRVNQRKFSKIASVCRTLESSNSNCRYLNLFREGIFSDDDFFDADHLNDIGAKKCSRRVRDFIANK